MGVEGAAALAHGPPTAGKVALFTPHADGQGLPVVYRDVAEVLADAGMGLRASQVCRALGTGTADRHREGMRSKLKRLVGRGWLVEGEPGLFTCASGVAGALEPEDAPPGPAGAK